MQFNVLGFELRPVLSLPWDPRCSISQLPPQLQTPASDAPSGGATRLMSKQRASPLLACVLVLQHGIDKWEPKAKIHESVTFKLRCFQCPTCASSDVTRADSRSRSASDSLPAARARLRAASSSPFLRASASPSLCTEEVRDAGLRCERCWPNSLPLCTVVSHWPHGSLRCPARCKQLPPGGDVLLHSDFCRGHV